MASLENSKEWALLVGYSLIILPDMMRFEDQSEAKRLLFKQQKPEEALVIKREGDSLVNFRGYLMAMMVCL